MRSLLFILVIFFITAMPCRSAPDFANPDVSAETVKYLEDLFANTADNYTCLRPTDVAVFPKETYLEGCIRKNMTVNRWPLTCGEAALMKKIVCLDTRITSLEGLQQFPNLETIFFDSKSTQIEDLSPIRNLMKLSSISIPNSNISDTAFLSAITGLRLLNLSGNKVTDLKYMPYLKKLETLSLEYQGPVYITDITPLGFLRNLQNLSLQGNRIPNIAALGELRGLLYLNIRDNRITDLAPLANIPNLSGLNASINIISDLTPLENLTKITFLAVNSNRLTSMVPITNMTDLRQIQLIGNSITDIAPLADKRKILSVSLDYNGITDLSPIYTIKIYSDLSELGLAYNCIPEENYDKLKYSNEINKLRLDHQCETFDPADAVADISFVVNADLVGAENILDNVTGGIGNIEENGVDPLVAGRGCMVGSGEDFDGGYIIFLALILLNYIRHNRRKSR